MVESKSPNKEICKDLDFNPAEHKPMDSILEQNEFQKSLNMLCTEFYHSPETTSAKFEDFELLNLIGKGSFGKVFLVRKKSVKD
jgi:hypothetical protein